jgi:Prokaryotic N-terminal methylation motif
MRAIGQRRDGDSNMLSLRARASRLARAQRGLSIVELLVGVAIGLVVVAAAALLVSGQLVENRRLMIEAALQQDLRATADIITRDLRRVGALPEETQSAIPAIVETAFLEGTTLVQAARNTHYAYPAAPAKQYVIAGGPGANEVIVAYSASDLASPNYVPGPYGFRRVGDVIESRRPGGSSTRWDNLTDPKLMQVTRLSITESPPGSSNSEVIPCPNPCTGNSTSCWPRVVVRDVTVVIEANATADPTIKRAITSRVRLRNDEVLMHVTGPGTYDVCPPP